MEDYLNDWVYIPEEAFLYIPSGDNDLNQEKKSLWEMDRNNGGKFLKMDNSIQLLNLNPCKSYSRRSDRKTYKSILGLIEQTNYASYKPTNSKYQTPFNQWHKH